MGLLYTGFKVFHYKEKLDSLPPGVPEIRSPIHIRIKPTNVCNHNCHYCAYRAEKLQLGQDMRRADFIPKDKMMEVIDDLVDMGVQAVTFSGGGEPLCYPYILEAVRKLSKSSIRVASLTNGSRLTGEVAEFLAYHAVWVRISIDGWDDESYSGYRRVPGGEFSRLINNIETFKAMGGGCYLGISLIVDRFNARHVFELTGRMKNAGADSVKISPCIVSNDGDENNSYHAPIFEVVKEQVRLCLEELADEHFEIYDSYHEMDNKFHKDYQWCPYLQILPVIGADLNIYPCQDKAYNLKEGLLGSIRERRFREFWFQDKKTFFKINPSLQCMHHCVANTKNRMILEYLNAEPGHLPFV